MRMLEFPHPKTTRRLRAPVQTAVTAALLVLAASLADAATPVQQCASGKSRAAGAYAACRANAHAKLATTGNATKFADALAACGAKLATVWAKLEAKAARAGATCLD